jgi:hypothetical protein
MIPNQATVKNFYLISIASAPHEAIANSGTEKQKSLPLPFEMVGRRKTILLP